MVYGRRVLPLAIAACAIGLIATSGVLRQYASRPRTPGELVAEEPQLEWRSPPPIDGHAPNSGVGKFKLKNRGGTSVKILAVRSDCGYTIPRVEPTLIEPRASGEVVVEAKAPAMGEKYVTIVLETDSPRTPVLPLRLRLIGAASPPFLLRAEGDLNYLEDIAHSEPREIRVLTIEKLTSPTAPRITSDLSFLEIESVRVIDDVSPYPSTIGRTYVYRVSARADVPRGTISGTISIASPWDSTHVLSLLVRAPDHHRIRVFPSPLVVNAGNPAHGVDGAGVRFFVLMNDQAHKPHLEVEAPAGSPLVIKSLGGDEAGRVIPYSVHLKSAPPVESGDYPVSIRSPLLPEPDIIQVTVQTAREKPHG